MDLEMMNAGILTEVYKFIPGYNTFLVSNLGNIKHISGKPKAFTNHSKGYLQVCLTEDRVTKQHSVHRLVAEAFLPNDEGFRYVDHRDGNRKNNIRTNLRWCTSQQNSYNRIKRADTTSIFRGVYWASHTSKWRAQIKINNNRVHLGLFTDEIEAAKAYDARAKIEFKEFAKLNFPEEV